MIVSNKKQFNELPFFLSLYSTVYYMSYNRHASGTVPFQNLFFLISISNTKKPVHEQCLGDIICNIETDDMT